MVEGVETAGDKISRLTKELEAQQEQHERALKVQSALYRIAEAVGAVRDVGEFYATMHRIVGELMYAQNFYIILVDPLNDWIEAAYFADQNDYTTPPPGPRSQYAKTPTLRVYETGESLHLSKADFRRLIREGTLEPIGPISEDWIGVPLKDDERTLGVVVVQSYDKGIGYSEQDVEILTFVARHIAAALTRARAIEETRQRNLELQIINSVQEGLASRLDLKDIYELLGDQIRQIFAAQTVVIYSFDLDQRTVTFEYIHEKGERLEAGTRPMSPLNEYVLSLGNQPFVVNTGVADILSKYQHSVPAGEMPKSVVSVPFYVQGTLRGAISLQDMDREYAFSENDIKLLETLANSMSVALENARLFDETQRLLKETEERNAELSVINSVQEGLASKLDMRSIFELVGSRISEIFPDHGVGLYTYDEETDLGEGIYLMERGERKYPPPIRPGAIGRRVMESDKPMLISTRAEFEEIGATVIEGTDPSLSGIYAPLKVNDKFVGALNVENPDKEHAFSDSDLQLVTTIANSMSVALENARLFDETTRLLKETEQRAAELALINSVQQGLAEKLEIQAIYDLVGEKIREIFDAQVVIIGTLDHERRMERVHYMIEKGQRFTPTPRPFGVAANYLLKHRVPIHFNTEEECDRFGLQTMEGTQSTKSLVFVPLITGDQVSGVISLQNVDREYAFEKSDIDLLTTLAASMSVALENARLFEMERQRVNELATVNTVSNALAGELDLDALIHLVGEQIRTTFKADIAYVALLDDHKQTINFPYQYGERLVSLPYGRGLTSRIIESGKPLLINQDLDRRRERLGGEVIGKRARSYLGVPIVVGGEAIGVVSVQNTEQEDVFSEDDQRLLGTIAANVGTAIRNARLFNETLTARRAAEQANRAKSTFLANMSHELRTPLNAITGFTRIVRRKGEGLLPEKQIENLDKVLISAEHLLGLINTVLDISKIEAGRMEVQPAAFKLPPLIELVVATSQPLLRKGVALETKVPPDLPPLYSDQDKIKQILLNLLSNAAKFTHEGKITLSVRQDGSVLYIDVRDTGIGISEEALERIFEEFQQADSGTTRAYGGTGLGLPISRSLARLLDGDLTVTSREGIGSVFTLTMPFQYDAVPAARDSFEREIERVPRGGKPLVLVIDDNQDVHQLLQQNLSDAGYQVVGASSGDDGIQMAHDLNPAAITLDIMMPHKDGWQVLHELKSDPHTRHIPVILLTIVDKKSLGYRLGASEYLVKPLDEEAVLSALERLTKSKNGLDPKRLLIVDDDPNMIEMVGQLLEGTPYEITTAEDGELALEAIRSQAPDAILLDLIMPCMDGFGLIDELQKDSRHKHIPIIVLTAKSLTVAERENLQNCVQAIIEKQGLDNVSLVREIEHALARYE